VQGLCVLYACVRFRYSFAVDLTGKVISRMGDSARDLVFIFEQKATPMIGVPRLLNRTSRADILR
jgi:hypothetical protein